MTQNGRNKLLMEGWIIIRKDDTEGKEPGIKQYNENGGWEVIARFPTKAARDRAFKQKINEVCVIED